MSEKYHTLGSGPVEQKYLEQMRELARFIDHLFNGPERPRKTGFILMVFDFDDLGKGLCNYMSNADRKDVITMLKEQLAYLEGAPDKIPPGHA